MPGHSCVPHKHGKPLPFSQPLASRREACFPIEGCSGDGVGVGALRGSLCSPGLSPSVPSPGLHLLGLVKREGGEGGGGRGRGALLGGRSRGFLCLSSVGCCLGLPSPTSWQTLGEVLSKPAFALLGRRLKAVLLCSACAWESVQGICSHASVGTSLEEAHRHSGSSAG